ncbi:hypothetical protein L1049_001303 [Liquidambar formosana]|uniref:HMA domain-containing protein n=1 Tax=Liquidambar formosana TaxID=63359 RepID=A0AAP0NC72_LIQFO
MVKVELQVDINDDKTWDRARDTMGHISGAVTIGHNVWAKKMVVIGEVDLKDVLRGLRKHCHAEIIHVGAHTRERRKEPKQEEPKKTEGKKKDSKCEVPAHQ